MNSSISQYASDVDFSMIYIIVISIVMLIGVTFVMLLFIYKYHHKRNPKPTQTHGSVALETVWIVVPTFIVLSMFYVGYADFSKNRADLDNADNIVKVTGQQFDWRFTYDNGATLDTLFVPVNKITRFDITSIDVIHSFYIPSMRIKEDAVPGRINQYTINPLKTGSFDIACTEYCGVRHWDMYTKINVVTQEEYDAWYAEVTKTVEAETPKEEVAATEEVTEEIQE
jgi:cytochrome c oxidase subunit 2